MCCCSFVWNDTVVNMTTYLLRFLSFSSRATFGMVMSGKYQWYGTTVL
jgi:hypothetical protein